jgi:hypothetical protein
MKLLIRFWICAVLAGSNLLQPWATFAAEAKAEDESKKKDAESEAKTGEPAIRLATPADLERLYLDGRITAKEYQRKLAEYKASTAALTNKEPQAQAVEALRQQAKKAPTQPTPAAKPAPPKPAQNPTATPAPEDKKLTEVEAKFDQLIQKKAEREKAQAATNAPPASPKTKREKLDALLKAYIDGKLSEKDYNEQRAKVVSEPD